MGSELFMQVRPLMRIVAPPVDRAFERVGRHIARSGGCRSRARTNQAWRCVHLLNYCKNRIQE